MEREQSPELVTRRRWERCWREVQELNLSDPRAAVTRAEAWLDEDVAGEGRALALRALAYALRTFGAYERAEHCFLEAEQVFAELGLHDEVARAKLRHVAAPRHLGRHDEAIA